MNSQVKAIPKYTLSSTDTFGLFIYAMLDNPTYINQVRDKSLDAELTVHIPTGYFRKTKMEMSNKQVEFFNRFLYESFNKDYFTFMQMSDMFGVPDNDAINAFCTINGLALDVDIEYETLKKRYYRFREENGHPRTIKNILKTA